MTTVTVKWQLFETSSEGLDTYFVCLIGAHLTIINRNVAGSFRTLPLCPVDNEQIMS